MRKAGDADAWANEEKHGQADGGKGGRQDGKMIQKPDPFTVRGQAPGPDVPSVSLDIVSSSFLFEGDKRKIVYPARPIRARVPVILKRLKV